MNVKNVQIQWRLLFQADFKIGYKNCMMDLRKITNHPYLIKYPLTEDGIFYKIDEGKFITH